YIVAFRLSLRSPCATRDLHSIPTRRSSDLDLFAVGMYVFGEYRTRRIAHQTGGTRGLSADAIEQTSAHAGRRRCLPGGVAGADEDRKSTRLNSSHVKISYAVFCLKKRIRLY